MEITQGIKDLLNAYELLEVTDFVDYDELELYLENTELDKETIKQICEIYQGWDKDSISEKIIRELRNNFNK